MNKSTQIKSKKILITGGGGYIGTCVVEQLLKEGYSVRVYDKFYYGKRLFNTFENTNRLELIKGDIRDKKKLSKSMLDIHSIIHLAGIVGDLACSVDKTLSHDINITGTTVLKDISKSFPIERFIFASSCSVYGQNHHVVNELSPINPLSIYAQTKLASEKILLEDVAETFHPVILRFTTVFGHSPKPRFDLVANLFTAQAYSEGEITIMGGEQWRPFIHVRDIARAISLVLKAPRSKITRHIFNVGDDTLHLQIKELGYLVQGLNTKKHISLRIVPNPTDKRNYRVSFAKIQKYLGFAATISVKEGLQEIYDNFSKNLYKKPFTHPYYSSLQTEKSREK